MKNNFLYKVIIIFLLLIYNQAYSNDLALLNSNPVNGTDYKINQIPKIGDIMFTRDIIPNTAELTLYSLSNKQTKPIELEKIRVKSSYLISYIIPELSYGEYKIIWRIKPCLENCLSNKKDNLDNIDFVSGEIYFNVVKEDNSKLNYNYLFFIIFMVSIIFFILKMKKAHLYR